MRFYLTKNCASNMPRPFMVLSGTMISRSSTKHWQSILCLWQRPSILRD